MIISAPNYSGRPDGLDVVVELASKLVVVMANGPSGHTATEMGPGAVIISRKSVAGYTKTDKGHAVA